MFRIADGREHFYQWDIDRQVIVEDPTITQVHFCNRTDDCSLVTEVKDGRADVPNILLQSSYDMRVFGYDGKATLYEKKFKVSARTRPADYVYTETEVRTVQTVLDRANLTLDQTNEALQNTEEALANSQLAIDNANAAATEILNNANEAVEIANTANERAEVAISDVERFANEAKESAEQAQAAVVNYYTKEEHATNYSDAKEVVYFDFPYEAGTRYTEVSDEYNQALNRLFSGEQLTVYVKGFYNWAVSDFTMSSTTITFKTHFTDFFGKAETTITEYTTLLENGRWLVRRTDNATYKFATKEYVDEAVSNVEIPEEYITETELEAKGYAETHKLKGISRTNNDGVASLLQLLAVKYGQESNGLFGVLPHVCSARTLTSFVDAIGYEGLVQWTGEDKVVFGNAQADGMTVNGYYVIDSTGTVITKDKTSFALRTGRYYIRWRAYFFEFESLETVVSAIKNNITSECVSKEYLDEVIAGIDIPDVSNFITEIPSEYVTETELDAKGYALKADIPSTEGLATEAYVDAAVAAGGSGAGNDSYVLDFSYVKDDYQNCTTSMKEFIDAVVNGTVLTSTIVAVKVGNNITPVMVEWAASTSEIKLIPLVSINHLNDVLYGQYANQTYAVYLINASTQKYKRYNYGYARPESWANTGIGGGGSGDGGWLYTTNRFDSDLYSAKELYIELVDYEYTGGNCIFSHVIFNADQTDYLGNHNYQPYSFTTPHGRDDATPYWSYNGSWIDIYSMGSYDVTIIAYKK